ncbi:flavin reductase family protein [Amorphus orientalis]|uniref:Flavin reductase (DIM6/NTAB) family NADH-FMN oxidoreductase RutF n=1 Tax=Amorphus orientalis TaxID=649198 RepID=A0AAE3VR43_9HYPH|nr:flavin reductase family protein [Amorphus orientalis]MDQ0317199.1 flavin reductase (DIM6/NTAB) family NADH-FMN oxidoreductase RutF [Amorphus orientalis]
MAEDGAPGFRHFDFTAMSADECYRLLASSVVPRPIAWVVSRDKDGLVNAAPYSFFNCFGGDPPVIALGILPQPDRPKDTARNILDSGDFVVNLVTEDVAEAMNLTCIDAPADVSELDLAGLETAPCEKVGPPRIVASPVALECRLAHHIWTGPKQLLIVGHVVAAHYRRDIIDDGDRPRIDTAAMGMVGRMHGRGSYARTTDLFEMERPRWSEYKAARKD